MSFTLTTLSTVFATTHQHTEQHSSILFNLFFFTGKMADHAPSVATEAVLKPSSDLPEDLPKIRGYDFNQGVDLQAVLKSYLTTGFQASRLGLAIQEINHMVINISLETWLFCMNFLKKKNTSVKKYKSQCLPQHQCKVETN